MKLNHLNLIVTNVPDAVAFFETYFDFRCTATKGDNVIAVLEGTDNFILVLMATKTANSEYPINFHIGFMLNGIEEVDGAYNKLKEGGLITGEVPRKIRDAYGFYFHFQNVMIEVGYYLVAG